MKKEGYGVNGRAKKLGARIQEARRAQNMSQVDFADKLNISLSHMSDIETGKSNFGVDILMRITEVLQLSADKLLRTDIPEVNAIYAAEVESILDGCTPEEADALLKMLREMKSAIGKTRSLRSDGD